MRNPPSDRRAIWAAYVRRLREVTGISRPEMARRLGVDPATVWRWETQKQKPESPDIPAAMAQLFGLDVDEVLAAAGLTSAAETPPERVAEVDDEELELVRTDQTIDPEDKLRIVTLIMERRERERSASLADTRRLIELMRQRRREAG